MDIEKVGGSYSGAGNNKPGIDKMAERVDAKLGAEGGKIADKVHDAVDRASARASDMATKARKSFSGWIHDLGAVMEQHPVATVFIGVGAGYIFAKIRAWD